MNEKKPFTALSKNTSVKNLIHNESKISDISPDVLKWNVEKIIANLLADYGQNSTDEEFIHLSNRVFHELVVSRKNLMFGEFSYVIESGLKGKWEVPGKLSFKTILRWLEGYRQEMVDKKFRHNEDESKKMRLKAKGDDYNPKSQFFAKAFLLMRENPDIKPLGIKLVAERLEAGVPISEIKKESFNLTNRYHGKKN